MALKPGRGVRRSLYLALSLALSLQSLTGYQAIAQGIGGPTGTMLLPMTPKLDTAKSRPTKAKPAATPASTDAPTINMVPGNSADNADSVELLPDASTAAKDSTKLSKETPKTDQANKSDAKQASASSSAPSDEMLDATIADDTTLKGTVQIVADDTEYDQDKNTFLGTGNAVAIIAGQDSKLEADMILYDQNDQTMDARGNVHIYRNGQLTTGSSFKFKVTSDEYLITKPDTEVQGSQIVARLAEGTKNGLTFKNGTMTPADPIYIQRNANWGPISYREEMQQKMQHPDAYLGGKQHVVFKARKMVYERYKEQGNLTIYGGKLQCGKFAIPLGKLTATVGGETRVTMPITPMFSNNLQVGGLNVGPRFNTGIGKDGVLSWAPLIQFGGKLNGVSQGQTNGSVGLGGQVSYTNNRLTTHLAYGTVSNLLVGDFKYKISKGTKYQAGINRYLDDGMFGYRRARLISEVVDNHPIRNIPFLASMNFRSSAGWAQDNPQLINQSAAYGQLFGAAAQNKTVMRSGFRLQEQITATTHPLFVVGDDKWGAKSYIYGGVGARGYSTGNALGMAQMGPVLDAHLNKVRLQTGYTQSAVKGSSPFVFDQFIQGTRSAYVSGDVKASKFVTLGGTLGYNFDNKLAYAKTITAAIGPDDCKLILSRDMIRGTNRFGFDLLMGAPIPFTKMVMKQGADQGQQGQL